MIGVGVIGYGYWGPNLVRNFFEAPGCEVRAVCDSSESRLAAARSRLPGIDTTTDAAELIQRDDVDLIVIATPVSSHHPLALSAIGQGKHVLVEKPMASSVAQAQEMIERAREAGVLLMVDHTFVFTGAVEKMRELIASGALGDIYYYDSVRVNLGLLQHDVDVLWDLAVHDLSIMTHVTGRTPVAVSATGAAHVPGRPEDVAFMSLLFDDTMIAHVHVNWLAPVKVRRTLVGGSKRMIVYDDLEPSEKIKVYDSGITVQDPGVEDLREILVSYRTGDMVAPKLSMHEGLRKEAEHVLACVRGDERPLVPGEAGLDVVRILAAASASVARGGSPVQL